MEYLRVQLASADATIMSCVRTDFTAAIHIPDRVSKPEQRRQSDTGAMKTISKVRSAIELVNIPRTIGQAIIQ